MDFIRWHALSAYSRWMPLLQSKGCEVIQFHHNLENVERAWAKENHIHSDSEDSILKIGLEKIKRFKPDIIFCTSPLSYINNHFIDDLLDVLETSPKLIAWYGANCGNEKIFAKFDLTLSNSKHLADKLLAHGISAELLQHSFDPIILEKIDEGTTKKNRIAFFGSLDAKTDDFRERTELLNQISTDISKFDIFGDCLTPTFSESAKFCLLTQRSRFAKIFSKIISYSKLEYWYDINNLPASPWIHSKGFIKSIKRPLFGKEMLNELNSYQIAFNYHNKHTGDYACNMRIFEATGLGCCLLTDYKSNIHSMFEEDKEVITYKTNKEAISKANQLLQNPNIAKEIGLAGQKKTMSEFTTEKQINHLYFHLSNLLN